MATEPMRVGDYEILNRLGAGGMGQVYRVRNVISDRIEAMKILLPSLSEHREVAERFLREIKLVASLHHPNIANLCTATAINNQLVMVMEYVDGRPFSELLSNGAIPTNDALNYFDQALAALEYAHERGIVHRDLKPSNIMLTHDGVVKLMDFGIARSAAEEGLTQTGATLGTVSYMSPEQIGGGTVDQRSDLYSMGIFFYQTLTGQQPFTGDSDYELMVAHMQQIPRMPLELAPGLPPGVNEIVMKLLAKAPAERFQTASQVRAALAVVTGSDIRATGPMAANARPGTPLPVQTAAPGFGTSATPRPAAATGAASGPASWSKEKRVGLYAGGALALAAALVALLIWLPASKAKTGTTPSTVPYLNTGETTPDTLPAPARAGAPPPAQDAVPVHQQHPLASSTFVPGPGRAAASDPAPGSGSQGTKVPSAGTQPGSAPNLPSSPGLSAQEKEQMDLEELHLDQLSSRAAALNNSLERMQRNMEKDGMSLRADMAGRQSSMNLNLGKATQALAANDPQRASRFASAAEKDIGQLETFLGR